MDHWPRIPETAIAAYNGKTPAISLSSIRAHSHTADDIGGINSDVLFCWLASRNVDINALRSRLAGGVDWA